MTRHVSPPVVGALPQQMADAVTAEAERVCAGVLMPRGLERRRVLIVGGAGYIGTPLTQGLLAAGYQVRCLDLMLYRNHQAVTSFLGHPDYDFLRGDLAREEVVEAALDGVSDVIILAGLVGDPITRKYPEASRLINDEGMLRLLDRLNGHGLNKVIFVSTCSNYGEIPPDALADENYPLKPLSLYAKAKVQMETELLGRRGAVDYSATVLRFATAFGLSARMRFDLTVGEFTRDLFETGALEVYDADTWRPYCHVRDFARALIRVLEAPVGDVAFEVFNAGGDVNNYTKEMIVGEVCRFFPEARVKFVAGGTDRRNYKVDFGKIRRVLHFEPVFTVPDGVRELVQALKDGFFPDYHDNLDFYRNNTITYPE